MVWITCPHAVIGIGANVAWYFNQFKLDTGLDKVAIVEGEGRICVRAGHGEALRNPSEAVRAAGVFGDGKLSSLGKVLSLGDVRAASSSI